MKKIKNKYPDNFSKYDYSLIPEEVTIRDSTKVNIICNKHGVFEQGIAQHLRGAGCRSCGVANSISLQKSNIKEFIRKANEVHNTFYTYPRFKYGNCKTKGIITCPNHGDFLQTPNNHLQGQGCPVCRYIKSKKSISSNTEEFIRKAILIHGKRYGYYKVDYKKALKEVIIICPIHGDFLQKPSKHLSGQGCPSCKESYGEKHISQVLDKFNIQYIREYKIDQHPYKYDFYLPEYNVYIEYHGIQHYKPIKHFGNKDKFDKTQRRDKAKIEIIKRSSGLLITLKYTFNTLEKIEDELLRLFSIIHPQFLSNKELTKQMVIDSNIYLIQDGISYKKI